MKLYKSAMTYFGCTYNYDIYFLDKITCLKYSKLSTYSRRYDNFTLLLCNHIELILHY